MIFIITLDKLNINFQERQADLFLTADISILKIPAVMPILQANNKLFHRLVNSGIFITEEKSNNS